MKNKADAVFAASIFHFGTYTVGDVKRFLKEKKISGANLMKANLPTREEINVYNSLDEQAACKNFLGKTLEEAQALFQETSLCFQEDLMWMGPVAFRYYVPAAIQYIQSPEATGDDCIIDCFAMILEFRLEHERQELLPIARQLTAACCYIITNYKRFNEADPELYIHLDFRPRYESLIQKLSSNP